MNREEFELALETMFEAIQVQLVKPLMKMTDDVFIAITEDAVDASLLRERLERTRNSMSQEEQETIGGRWLARCLLIAMARERGDDPEELLQTLGHSEPPPQH